MTKGRAKAIADLAKGFREKFPDAAGLTDEAIVGKYVSEEQVGHLANYYDALMPSVERLEKALASEND